MRFVIQRVLESEVKVDGESLGKIGKGFMVLIGVSNDDTKEVADKMVKKMLGLRIFEDEQGKTNLSLDAVGGELLLISQFTLYANCKRGNRPSFIEAGAPDMASEMYEYIIEKCKEQVWCYLEAFMALIIAEVKPLCSNSLIPLMVIPPGVVTLSISTLGWVSLF